jgi:hypothetical protein
MDGMNCAGFDEPIGQPGMFIGQWLALLDCLDDSLSRGRYAEESQR